VLDAIIFITLVFDLIRDISLICFALIVYKSQVIVFIHTHESSIL
jgi:hypothetical protein